MVVEAEAKANTASVDQLTERISSLNADWRGIARRQQEFQDRMLAGGGAATATATATPASGGQRSDPTYEATFLIHGVGQIREAWRMRPETDPRRAVAEVLKEVGCLCSVDRFFLADKKAEGDPNKTNTIGIQLRSAYHKKDALIKTKQLLNDYQLTGIIVRDCFPPEVMEEAKRLHAEGLAMKKKGDTASFRVINIRGQPVLQTRGRKQNRFYTVEAGRRRQEEEEEAMEEGVAGSSSSVLTGSNAEAIQTSRQGEAAGLLPPPGGLLAEAARRAEASTGARRKTGKQQNRQEGEQPEAGSRGSRASRSPESRGSGNNRHRGRGGRGGVAAARARRDRNNIYLPDEEGRASRSGREGEARAEDGGQETGHQPQSTAAPVANLIPTTGGRVGGENAPVAASRSTAGNPLPATNSQDAPGASGGQSIASIQKDIRKGQ
jgi:hypothetical protein